MSEIYENCAEYKKSITLRKKVLKFKQSDCQKDRYSVVSVFLWLYFIYLKKTYTCRMRGTENVWRTHEEKEKEDLDAQQR